MDRFELEVTEALRQLEIPAHLRGYRFIKSAMNYRLWRGRNELRSSIRRR